MGNKSHALEKVYFSKGLKRKCVESNIDNGIEKCFVCSLRLNFTLHSLPYLFKYTRTHTQIYLELILF